MQHILCSVPGMIILMNPQVKLRTKILFQNLLVSGIPGGPRLGLRVTAEVPGSILAELRSSKLQGAAKEKKTHVPV